MAIQMRRGNLEIYKRLAQNSSFDDKTKYSLVPKICVNCGAPLHGKVCKYCDTEYELKASV